MDFQRFGIDPRLAQAAEGLSTSFFFYEKMLTHVVDGQENVCVKISLDDGREEVLLMPALQWLLSGDGRKVLVVVPDAAGAERCTAAVVRLGSNADISVCRITHDDAESPPIRLEGDGSSSVIIGSLEDLMAAPMLNLRDYGFLVVDGVDRLADLPSDTIRKFSAVLQPSWERRSVLACAKISLKAKNLAWELADNPSELTIEGEVAKAQSVLKETWSVPVEVKLKFLLGLLEREKPARLCVFCNLKDTAGEVTRRLAANGIRTDSIIGALLAERKFALVEKFRAGDCTCLVLTDEGAEGLSPGVFPLIVNYDFPLEPEYFVKRLEMLDRSDTGAKVVSIACDRYIYGLPAVEQYIDAKLDVLPASDSMLASADKSEGMGGERRPRGDSYPKDSRRGQPQRRDANQRDMNPRGASSRDAFPRESSSPDIRKSISEATGGTLDINGANPTDPGFSRPVPSRPASGKHPPAKEPRRGQEHRGRGPAAGGRPAQNKDERRDDPRRVPNKPQMPRTSEARKQGPRQESSRPPVPQPGNPYDMPMEERMRIYREKYGHGLGENATGGGPRNERKNQDTGQRGGSKAPRAGRQNAGQSGQQGGPKGSRSGTQGRPRGPHQGGTQPQRPPLPNKPEQRPSPPSTTREEPRVQQNPRSEVERKPEGLVNRLLAALKRKKG
jgi:ATP-dependent RNA helicase RhlB